MSNQIVSSPKSTDTVSPFWVYASLFLLLFTVVTLPFGVINATLASTESDTTDPTRAYVWLSIQVLAIFGFAYVTYNLHLEQVKQLIAAHSTN